MTQIDFHILASLHLHDRIHYSCRLIDKAYKKGHRILVYSDDEAVSAQVSHQLWHYRADAFLPHGPADQVQAIGLGSGDNMIATAYEDIVINLAQAVPPDFQRFQRLLEIVDQTDALLPASRQRYRFYTEQGYTVQHHDLR